MDHTIILPYFPIKVKDLEWVQQHTVTFFVNKSRRCEVGGKPDKFKKPNLVNTTAQENLN